MRCNECQAPRRGPPMMPKLPTFCPLPKTCTSWPCLCWRCETPSSWQPFVSFCSYLLGRCLCRTWLFHWSSDIKLSHMKQDMFVSDPLLYIHGSIFVTSRRMPTWIPADLWFFFSCCVDGIYCHSLDSLLQPFAAMWISHCSRQF